MSSINDTIAAVATAPGVGGVAVVRLSGDDALRIARSVFKIKGECEPRRLYYGYIERGKERIDDGFMLYMRGPRSFTGEDVVEFHCHGGLLIVEKLLTALYASGARAADAGEFTRRAFLNGKLDLARAEAVSDLIEASTENALISARGRLDGRLSARITQIKDVVLDTVAHLEAELDFDEDEVDALPDKSLLEAVHNAEAEIEGLLATYDEGRLIRDGIRVLILGRPNVGKSSLLNLLLREERAIVTPHAGTTRDLIEESINIRGLRVRLMDTAGLRDTVDEIEAIGVERAKERITDAGLILFVIDASSEEDFLYDKGLLEGFGDKKAIVIVNKVELAGEARLEAIGRNFEGSPLVYISAKSGDGLDELEKAVYEVASGRILATGPESSLGSSLNSSLGEMIVSARHKGALEASLAALTRVVGCINDGLTRDIIAGEMRLSLDRLGEITGETTTDDILDKIFDGFCIGK